MVYLPLEFARNSDEYLLEAASHFKSRLGEPWLIVHESYADAYSEFTDQHRKASHFTSVKPFSKNLKVKRAKTNNMT